MQNQLNTTALWLCLLLTAVVCTLSPAQVQDPVKLMAYNLLNYPDAGNPAADTALRHPYFRTVIAAADPDILVVEELNSQAGLNAFLNKVMNAQAKVYGVGTYINSYDTDRGIFFRTSKFQFISNTPIATGLRDINEFRLLHLASGDTLRIYAVHLKASTGISNEQQRASEVDSLRKVTNSLPPGSDFIVCGDFNIYGSGEAAYQKLLQVQPGNEGHVYDALNLPGTWNNPAYALHHTQSPRLRSFGGGVTGGLDDRFDMILYSKGIHDPGGLSCTPGSLLAFGNDGNHYNDSIHRPPNTAVTAAVAEALHHAADHLPVMLTLNFTVSGTTAADAGVQAFVQPASSCPDDEVTLRVRVRNYGPSLLNFSTQVLSVQLSATSPAGVTTPFTAVLSSGSLAPGADTLVTFQPAYNMTQGGTYVFEAYTSIGTGDANAANDTMPVSYFTVSGTTPPVLSPAGPLQLCGGSTLTLSVSGGVAYLWPDGSTASSLQVSAAGSYTVTVTTSSGCTSVLGPVLVTLASAPQSDTVFYEHMGSVSSTTSIATHELNNGFLRDELFMNGNADVRNTLPSATYAGASGAANVFITNLSGRNFQIGDINTSARSNVQLHFGVYKSTSASTGADFKVQYSSDGVNYSDLPYPALPAGAGWYYRTCSIGIPSAANLRIRFLNTGTATQYRVDDVLMTATPAAQISSTGGNTLCPGVPLVLSAGAGTSYLWSTGATTQSISVSDTGTYAVSVDCLSSDPFVVYSCASPVLNLRLYLQGYYLSAGQMRARLYDSGQSTNPAACDSILVQLRGTSAPYPVAYESQVLLDTSGQASLVLPAGLLNQSFYLVVKHRSSVETWSKIPVLIGAAGLVFDFSAP
ncbi:MAG: endonuclease/exonuclease/phosphatase family protein [Bacteroidia bacterium]|nr:endonuclease/exonuclease/phosphatase family protein [Bacteroidia bacterium]